MAITASDVNALRQKTGVGMMDCKKALTEANGDMDKAVEILREKGMATAAKKAGRIAAEGIVDSYIHMGGKVGVLVEVNCETDFVARGDQFKELVHDIALQIAAAKPLYVTKEEVPAEVLEEEKKILKVQAMNEGKPEAIAEKMVAGRIKKYYEDFCLLEQPFVKDSSKPRPSASSSPRRSPPSAKRSRCAVSRVLKWAKASKRRRTTSRKKSKNKSPK